MTRGIILIACCLLSACGAGERVTSGPAVRDSAGTRFIESHEPAWTAAEAWTVARSPAVEIGAVETEAEDQFDRVADAFRLPDGRIVVANDGSGELRFYGPDGRHLRTAGGKGRGPGEFMELSGCRLIGDSILVFDPTLERVSILDTRGDFLGSFRLEPTGDPLHPLQLYRMAGAMGTGLLLVASSYPADMRPKATLHWDSVAPLMYGRDGALRDTIGEFPGMDIYATPERAGPLPFGRSSSAEVHGGELYITDGGRYEVRVYGPDGGLRRMIRLPREPREVSAADEDLMTRAYLSSAGGDADRIARM